jgi:hypothetical protein
MARFKRHLLQMIFLIDRARPPAVDKGVDNRSVALSPLVLFVGPPVVTLTRTPRHPKNRRSVTSTLHEGVISILRVHPNAAEDSFTLTVNIRPETPLQACGHPTS